MTEVSSSSPSVQEYPNVHAAYEIFLEYNKAPPENATQLVKWCSKQGIKDIQYAQVNKYLRMRKKPVVKSSNEPVRAPAISANVKQYSKRILDQLEDHSKTRTSAELGFDKGQTKSSNFSSFIENFDKVAEEEKKAKQGQWDMIKQQKQQEFGLLAL
ncbi:hypothetical protein RFI_15373 [Reticulomyxa filosa]|uniref:Uncharacterized protein n=1 Tax=Reticulomyxa filosa TaxID=46433 RepID=X6N6C3_RETFI|nr:hypothetical protein RFI_15373 [Reticulomyxa filosa]|eukprot:ETO21830.1 hypothetical protein RFI_15373 [Reticulomyxa filosa]